jgi:hypothetical protein
MPEVMNYTFGKAFGAPQLNRNAHILLLLKHNPQIETPTRPRQSHAAVLTRSSFTSSRQSLPAVWWTASTTRSAFRGTSCSKWSAQHPRRWSAITLAISSQWKNAWPPGHLMQNVDRHELPPIARRFLRECALPKVIVCEAEGDNASMAFEWTFRCVADALQPYTKLIRWGDFYDAQKDRFWSSQLVMGQEEFCNGRASLCVDAADEYVTRIDCELSEMGLFMNSSLPQFGASILAAAQWAEKFGSAEKRQRRALYAQLLDAMALIDLPIRQSRVS